MRAGARRGYLIAGRILQSLGAAAGTVLARAIVRDLFSGTAMTRFFSTRMVVSGITPVVAPVIGGQLLRLTTWRVVFLVLAAAGGALLLAIVFALPESLPDAKRAPAHPRARRCGPSGRWSPTSITCAMFSPRH
ncbi:MFS transporter [Streptomyces sp. NPDC101152]|uniref:MFS transporter n=1 Tax=Streptomyces sp. NPDC101152 TaxID=3366116 RepID=UPI00380B6715